MLWAAGYISRPQSGLGQAQPSMVEGVTKEPHGFLGCSVASAPSSQIPCQSPGRGKGKRACFLLGAMPFDVVCILLLLSHTAIHSHAPDCVCEGTDNMLHQCLPSLQSPSKASLVGSTAACYCKHLVIFRRWSCSTRYQIHHRASYQEAVQTGKLGPCDFAESFPC